MATIKYSDCELEIDVDRGVVYVHGPDGRTRVRICGLHSEAFKHGQMIDVNASLRSAVELIDDLDDILFYVTKDCGWQILKLKGERVIDPETFWETVRTRLRDMDEQMRLVLETAIAEALAEDKE